MISKRLDKSPVHVRNYYKAFNYDESDTILCECCGNPAVDIHHVEPRSSFGTVYGISKDLFEKWQKGELIKLNCKK